MLGNIHKGWLIAMAVVVVLVTLVCHYKERNSYQCQTCGARKDDFQWRVGLWEEFSIPLYPHWEEVSKTRFQRDFLPSGHTHDWIFAQGSPYYFFGTTWAGCALGAGRNACPLGQTYEWNSDFRDCIAQKIRDGSLTKAQVIEMFAALPLRSTSSTSTQSPLQKEAEELRKRFAGY